eukprot:5539772-Prorocentrum_lima.AAC.1
MSLYSAFDTLFTLQKFARNQSGGNVLRLFKHMCHLGDGLAPSDLFAELRKLLRLAIVGRDHQTPQTINNDTDDELSM